MLWIDKYRPHNLNDFSFNSDFSNNLYKLSLHKNIPHLLIYGPEGCGKYSRIMALLSAIFGPSIYKLDTENRVFEIMNRVKGIELTITNSQHHVEFSPSDAGYYDRVIIQEIIKEYAHTASINKSIRIILIKNVDRLSKNAQHSLRRTMEKYTKECRFILCCNGVGRIIDPLKSRCLMMRLSAPTDDEVYTILRNILHKENITNIGYSKISDIIEISNGNIKKSIFILQAKTLNPTIKLELEWKTIIGDIVRDALYEQSPAQIQKIRIKLYDLLSYCISGGEIILYMLNEILWLVDDKIKNQIINYACQYEINLSLGNKDILHLEAFMVHVIVTYRQFIATL